MITYLENEYLIVRFNTLGAEMEEILDRKSDVEYLWDGDPVYWKRHAPVLFPLVGSLKDSTYTYKGQTYKMSQHGFARDTEFKIIERTSNSIVFSMSSSEKTKEMYPFDFELQCSYVLLGKSIRVGWKVINKSQEDMYFSIGGHPAFYCTLADESEVPYMLKFDKEGSLTYYNIDENGLKIPEEHTLIMEREGLPLYMDFFKRGVYIFENQNVTAVEMRHPNGYHNVKATFDAPVFGIWSPEPSAPFVCIEPWYGRCDANNFEGTLEDREFGNHLAVGEEFETHFVLEFGC